ncbi:MarR family winged helix-turn-helix transcriptional regulator [Bordetella pseudohinzii]|uniref:MarR family n=1 Tax=Bordetella pseudohinzii TaxID=1331258 RepID=A0A0J6EV53_9BORD|nr:MarR family transcriptional regulator [Bordetella pseudohinzii]ANY15253.1 MarR family transcriptional regulator [Bordetella pseudohinzii]KMM24325.1 MarR family transcriptional regulator [Bordetella pseudohinzii]KXA77807.1 MarR family transcriptional regulator [Bordetella pseudohinzii]KXA79525.1 MarR family transcriptional regulator [Bordetella pseudohinzii]CUI49443.1 MarR family [Bordetella pseudohinzii]
MFEAARIVTEERHNDAEFGASGEPPAPQAGAIADIAAILSQQLAVYAAARQAAVAEKLGLSITELKALELVQELDALPTGQLGQLLGISWGGATALINRLEAAGFIQRGRHPLDRRIIVIRPIAERCKALVQARQAVLEEVHFLSRQFDAQQMRAVQAFLLQYVRSLRHDTQQWLQARSGRDMMEN